ncbi:hypothetical protein [Zavarzinia sp. CC-PAN008]|uniref:hypothetical protein n=1 Tax=Zavarzinia sp. CC-PAN008 TaxID=3243332 RepID=UPI003F7495BC
MKIPGAPVPVLALAFALALPGGHSRAEDLESVLRDYGGRDDTLWQIDCFQNGQKVISERSLIIDAAPGGDPMQRRYGFFTRDRKRVLIETTTSSLCIAKQM